jgi:hypothetical protein
MARYELDVRFKTSAVAPLLMHSVAGADAANSQRPQLLWDVWDSVAFNWNPPGMLPRTNGHLEVDREKRCVLAYMVPAQLDGWHLSLSWSCGGELGPHVASLVPAGVQAQIQLPDGRRVQHPAGQCFVIPICGELPLPAELPRTGAANHGQGPASLCSGTSTRSASVEAELRETRDELDQARVKQQELDNALAEADQRVSLLKQQLKSRPSQATAASLEAKLEEERACRRIYQEEIMNLRGRIRIFCRLRPNDPSLPSAPAAVTRLSRREVFLPHPQRHFDFDLVFGPETATSGIWEETWPLIDSVFEHPGTSACVMAYGQTGAGKTFTMEGTPQQPGLITLTLDRLFKKARQEEQQLSGTSGSQVEDDRQATQMVRISLSMLEVYQEQLRDLLGTQDGPRLSLRNIGGEGGPEVRELKIQHAKNCDDALSMYHAGARLRRLGVSDKNSRSSRSHLVLSVYVQRLDSSGGEVVSTSKVSLVDLAGSERQSAGTVFDKSRVSEASVINNSLTCLSKVVQACVTRASSPRPEKGMGCHIPYRDSMLTQLLSDSIGGQGKTLVIVHVTQLEEDIAESLRTLQFASSAACVQERPIPRAEEERLRRQLARLGTENQRLKEELSAFAVSSHGHGTPNGKRHASPKGSPKGSRNHSPKGSRDSSPVRRLSIVSNARNACGSPQGSGSRSCIPLTAAPTTGIASPTKLGRASAHRCIPLAPNIAKTCGGG